jgi:lactate permease
MLWALYQQDLNPLNNRLLSTLFAAVPVLVLFWLLVPRRWLASKAAVAGAVAALVVAWLVYGMPLGMAGMAFVHGALFGLMPVGWTIFNAMLLYNITVETGQFTVVRRSIAGLSGDARIQAILIGFAFGAFLEGAAGGGTPVAICGAIMVGLGFDPFLAAVLCLVANTSPVAYGGLGTPLITLSGVTNLPTEQLSIMAGHQLPLLSFIVPLYMVKIMCSWRQTWEVWPALLVSGGSFALFQFTFATIHAYVPSLVLYPMTDVGGGIFSLVVMALFLQVWKPRVDWHFTTNASQKAESFAGDVPPNPPAGCDGALPSPGEAQPAKQEPRLTAGRISLAWAPFVVMSVLLFLSGLVRQQERRGPVHIGPLQTRYLVPIPGLHNQSVRDKEVLSEGAESKPEPAEFNFDWLTSPGTAVFVAAVLSMGFLRMNRVQIARVIHRTVFQMRIPIPTIACMLGLSYVTRYGGLDATLGVAFASTGFLYPFFAAILGWLGVFLTGTDAGSNALFGSLQQITATKVSKLFHHLNLHQAQILICTANSTGGVMGKMIDAQSICVATGATNQLGREADIFKAVIWHSIVLATIVGALTMLQAYVLPFTYLVPH